MAKRRKVHVHDEFGKRLGHTRKVPIKAWIEPHSGSKKFAYEACVTINRQATRANLKHRRAYADRSACGYGPAPRRALAAALKKLGAQIVRRSSAFRGYRRRRR